MMKTFDVKREYKRIQRELSQKPKNEPQVKIVDNFQSFPTEVNFDNFSFSNYIVDEVKILEPQLEKLGYHSFRWCMGEQDSFGPLSRYVICKKDDKTFKFVYG